MIVPENNAGLVSGRALRRVATLDSSTSVSSVTENSWSLLTGRTAALEPRPLRLFDREEALPVTVVLVVRLDCRWPSVLPLALVRLTVESSADTDVGPVAIAVVAVVDVPRDDLRQPEHPQQAVRQRSRRLAFPASFFIDERNPLCHQA
uniref:Uncharacterized protein n=1 Tax=Anopheles atroparvus TaxID=41427 RepID=A0A182J5N7_ANOAO